MQPLPSTSHPNAASTFASLALCRAQRAFAPLLERTACGTAFGFAQVRGAARRGLSVLSADDRVRLARWLALLCATAGAQARACIEQRLVRVDAALAAAVAAAIGETPLACRTDGAVAA